MKTVTLQSHPQIAKWSTEFFTVKEFKEFLNKYPDDMPLAFEWEEQHKKGNIHPPYAYIEQDEYTEPVLIIDVEYC